MSGAGTGLFCSWNVMLTNGIIVTRNPAKCANNEIFSIIGNAFAPQVLNPIVITKKASMINVYCQLLNVKAPFAIWIIASIRVVKTKTLLETEASHPNVDIHPVENC